MEIVASDLSVCVLQTIGKFENKSLLEVWSIGLNVSDVIGLIEPDPVLEVSSHVGDREVG